MNALSIFLITISCLLWAGAFVALPRRIILSPALSYCAMLLLTFTKADGMPLFPLTNGLLVSWLCITLVTMLIIILQDPEIRIQSRGVLYMAIGGVAGMLVGLACISLISTLNLAYALMIIGAAAGVFLGFLLFSNTPRGRAVAPGSGNFFRYLLAKGFPTLITVAQLGIVLVVIVARNVMP